MTVRPAICEELDDLARRLSPFPLLSADDKALIAHASSMLANLAAPPDDPVPSEQCECGHGFMLHDPVAGCSGSVQTMPDTFIRCRCPGGRVA